MILRCFVILCCLSLKYSLKIICVNDSRKKEIMWVRGASRGYEAASCGYEAASRGCEAASRGARRARIFSTAFYENRISDMKRSIKVKVLSSSNN